MTTDPKTRTDILTVPTQPDTMQLRASGGTPVFTIKPDGKVELGPNVTPDQAGKAFWNIVNDAMAAHRNIATPPVTVDTTRLRALADIPTDRIQNEDRYLIIDAADTIDRLRAGINAAAESLRLKAQVVDIENHLRSLLAGPTPGFLTPEQKAAMDDAWDRGLTPPTPEEQR